MCSWVSRRAPPSCQQSQTSPAMYAASGGGVTQPRGPPRRCRRLWRHQGVYPHAGGPGRVREDCQDGWVCIEGVRWGWSARGAEVFTPQWQRGQVREVCNVHVKGLGLSSVRRGGGFFLAEVG